MKEIQNNNPLQFKPPKQRLILPLTIFLAFLFYIGVFCIATFTPNFIKIPKIISIFVNVKTQNYTHTNLCDYIQKTFFNTGNQKLIVEGVFYGILTSLSLFFTTIFSLDFIKKGVVAVSYKPGMKKYIIECAKIIESADPSTFNDRVAMLVPTCNDLTENSILQSMQQTYKNVDCGILDDSNNSEAIEKIKNFLQLNPTIKYFRRDNEHRKAHPSEMGNFMAGVDKHGSKYDYLVETNCSSLLTSTFVENALCYFHSPLLKNENVGCVLASGGFYHSDTITSGLISKNRQLSFSTLHQSSSIGARGNDIVARGGGTIYKTKAIQSIDGIKAECPVCDVARGREFIRNNFKILLNPFDFSSKANIRDINGYRKQTIKWNEGHIHLLRNKVSWGPCVKGKPFYMKWCAFFNTFAPIFFLISFVMKIIQTTYSMIIVVNYQNFSADLFKIVLQGIIMVSLIVGAFINSVSIPMLISQIFAPLMELSIYGSKLYDTIFTSLICKKGSAKYVSKKNNRNDSISQKFRNCGKHIVGLGILLGGCFALQFAAHMPTNLTGNKFFMLLGVPSILYIIGIFVGEIKIKGGGNSQQKYGPEFYKGFSLNYKIIKDHPIGIKQRQNDKNYLK